MNNTVFYSTRYMKNNLHYQKLFQICSIYEQDFLNVKQPHLPTKKIKDDASTSFTCWGNIYCYSEDMQLHQACAWCSL